MQILIATKNQGKLKGILESLQDFDAQFVSLADVGIEDEFEEEGLDFAEIALKKAEFYHGLSGLPTLADDSGILVEALRGELGVKTRRWGAGPEASDEEWLRVFMSRMDGEKNRNAEFICAAAFVFGEDREVFEGRTQGLISAQVEAPLVLGIPLSSVFRPSGVDKVYSALSSDEKRKFSHRAKAFTQIFDFLKSYAR